MVEKKKHLGVSKGEYEDQGRLGRHSAVRYVRPINVKDKNASGKSFPWHRETLGDSKLEKARSRTGKTQNQNRRGQTTPKIRGLLDGIEGESTL